VLFTRLVPGILWLAGFVSTIRVCLLGLGLGLGLDGRVIVRAAFIRTIASIVSLLFGLYNRENMFSSNGSIVV
jgi:hypothetical protein